MQPTPVLTLPSPHTKRLSLPPPYPFHAARRLAQHFVNNLWAIASTTPFYSVRIVGADNLPPSSTGAVYVANHQSFMVRGCGATGLLG